MSTEVNLKCPTEVFFSFGQKMCHSSEIHQLWGCSVNPPWQDCWDSSASTATLGELPASASTRQQSSRSGLRPIRTLQRWQARARSSFCSLSLWLLRFIVFLREKPGDGGRGEWRRDGEGSREREKEHASHSERSSIARKGYVLAAILSPFKYSLHMYREIWIWAGSVLACMNVKV